MCVCEGRDGGGGGDTLATARRAIIPLRVKGCLFLALVGRLQTADGSMSSRECDGEVGE